MYEHVCAVAHAVIDECYSRESIIPGLTSVDDLQWIYWQKAADRGLTMAFKPYFRLIRGPENRETFGANDTTIRAGDVIHCDVGLQYLRFNSDHQRLAYVLRPGDAVAPAGLQYLWSAAGQLQDIYLAEFHVGRTGNQLLANVLETGSGGRSIDAEGLFTFGRPVSSRTGTADWAALGAGLLRRSRRGLAECEQLLYYGNVRSSAGSGME